MRIVSRKLLVVLAVAIALAGVVATAPLAAQATLRSAANQLTTARQLGNPVLRLINAQRRKRGLRPLKLSQQLANAAISHARSMGKHGFFSHTSYDGTAPCTRIRRYFHGSVCGETLVWRAPDLSAGQAVQMWMNSPPHREILLSSSVTEVGLGAVHVDGGTGVYAGYDPTILVADFGAP
jgi:uncharacterized protein YkwD